MIVLIKSREGKLLYDVSKDVAYAVVNRDECDEYILPLSGG